MEDRLLIISDVAGQLGALERLQARYSTIPRVYLGDLNDRGNYSAEVIDNVMNDPIGRALMGNHEHMMLDFFTYQEFYNPDVFLDNGGYTTVTSCERHWGTYGIPTHVSDWMRSRPFCLIEDGLFLSHAPLHSLLRVEDAEEFTRLNPINRLSLIWNRTEPVKREGLFQVAGHNSKWGLKWFDDWGVSLDQTRQDILTGMLWPSKTIVVEPYDGGC